MRQSRFVLPILLAILCVGCARPYQAQRVSFEEGGPKLSGTLYSPRAGAQSPGLVIVPDSGPTDHRGYLVIPKGPVRQASQVLPLRRGFPIYERIARELASRGVAVLLYDKRGVGRSEGKWIGATHLDLAADAKAALHFLMRQPGVDANHVGMAAHGEGGYAAAVAEGQRPEAAFLILLAAPMVRIEQQLVTQVELEMRADGFQPPAVNKGLEFTFRSFAAIQAKDLATLEKLLDGARKEEWAYLLPPLSATDLAAYLRPLFGFDPTSQLKKVQCPTLGIYAALDCAVPPPHSAMRLDETLRAAGNKDFTIKIFPGANHHFIPAKTGGRKEWAELPMAFAPGFIEMIGDWIDAKTQAK